MLKKEVVKALNKQVSMEEFAARSYLVLAVWADHAGYEGAANFLHQQSQEEYGHMHKFIKFLLDAGEKPEISTYEEPLPQPDSFRSLFETGLKHEKSVTQSIHSMVDLAWQQKDFASFNFLQWFVEEQVEEENTFNTILDKIEMIEKQGGSLYMLDRELAARAGN